MSDAARLLPGDDIGLKLVAAARHLLDAAGADITWGVHGIGTAALAAGAGPLL